jgi:starch synthase
MVMLERIDIVHTHTWYVSMAGFLAKTLFDVPFVLTTHSLEPLRAWKAEQLGSVYRMSSWIERTAIHDADAIIAVSKGTREDILKAYPEVDPSLIHVIYNGIDLEQYHKASDNSALLKYGVDPTLPYVLFVGRITRQKGVTHLVDAISYMPKDIQVVLCAGAPDTPEIAAEMRAKVEAVKPVNPHVVWIEKMVTRAEAIQLYSHCRLFCCPSVYEPFGIINLEAMACEAPVVASATGGILEVVVDGETGCLVHFDQDPVTKFPADPEKFSRDLAARIAELIAAECRHGVGAHDLGGDKEVHAVHKPGSQHGGVVRRVPVSVSRVRMADPEKARQLPSWPSLSRSRGLPGFRAVMLRYDGVPSES